MSARTGTLAWGIALLLVVACGGDETVSDQGGAGGLTGASSTDSGFGAGETDGPGPVSSSSSTAATGGVGGKGGGGGAGGAGGGTCEYTSPNTCDTAEAMPDVAGDLGSDMQVVTGTTAKWFVVKVSESSNQPATVSYTVSLASPPAMDFDLFVTEGDSGGPNCAGQAGLGVGEPAEVTNSFSDQVGSDDSVVLSIEVRYISGSACGMDAQWTVTVAGNTQ